MEKIDVTSQLDPKGNLIPIRFTWKGQTYRVDSIGRSWQADDGFHVLVMDMRNQAYHLLHIADKSTWCLIRGGRAPTVPLERS